MFLCVIVPMSAVHANLYVESEQLDVFFTSHVSTGEG